MGVLLLAKQRGLVNAVAPLLDQLDAVDFWMSDSLAAGILRRAGER